MDAIESSMLLRVATCCECVVDSYMLTACSPRSPRLKHSSLSSDAQSRRKSSWPVEES